MKQSGHSKESRLCVAQTLILPNKREEDRRGNVFVNGEHYMHYYGSYQIY